MKLTKVLTHTREAHKCCKPVCDVDHAGVERGREARPTEQADHPRPALVQELLPTPERLVILSARPAIVGGKEDHGVLLETLKLQDLHDVANGAVQGSDGGCAALFLLCIMLKVP